MERKGERTKIEILSIAKTMFSERGFSTITMSDLCTATGLSRGGLYRHFTSTEEVFIAILKADKEDWQMEMKKAMDNEISAIQMMEYYLQQVQNEITNGAGGLSLAIYEFMRNTKTEKDFLNSRYAYALSMMKALLQYGQQRGEFKAFDPQTEAEHLVLFINGLQTASSVIPFTQDILTRQLHNLLENIKEVK